MKKTKARLQTDVVIVGAGPVGLFQIFELGLQGLKAIVIDSLPHTGGQCRELYADKPIYDIPALPKVMAGELIDNLLAQASPFAPEYLLDQRVQSVTRQADKSFMVTTEQGSQISCKAVVIAGGNGAFEPVRLKVPGIEAFEGKQLLYRVGNPAQYREKTVAVLGGGDSAFDWAFSLQQAGANVVLVHRSMNFRAAQAQVNKMQAMCDRLEMQFVCGQVSDFKQKDGLLTSLLIQAKDGVKRMLDIDRLVVCFGLSPKPGPIASWGLNMNYNLVCVDTEKYQTSIPGIYAVGDINYYPGKRKLILSGFHEAALAAFAIAQQLNPEKRVSTLYTTTSPVIQQRMGLVQDIGDMELV